MLPNATLLLQLKYKYKYNHKRKDFVSMCSSFAWGKLIMKQKAVGLILGTNRTEFCLF